MQGWYIAHALFPQPWQLHCCTLSFLPSSPYSLSSSLLAPYLLPYLAPFFSSDVPPLLSTFLLPPPRSLPTLLPSSLPIFLCCSPLIYLPPFSLLSSLSPFLLFGSCTATLYPSLPSSLPSSLIPYLPSFSLPP